MTPPPAPSRLRRRLLTIMLPAATAAVALSGCGERGQDGAAPSRPPPRIEPSDYDTLPSTMRPSTTRR